MTDTTKLTTSAGAPVADNQNSLSAGARGPLLLQDYQLLEKLAHQNRERIPERVVHAKGWGAFGTLTVTQDISKYTHAKLFDAIGKMESLVPNAHLYTWRDRGEIFSEGRVHAKVAVADRHTCFITSANLTGFAMDRNIEAGLLLSGGNIPQMLEEHLRALVSMKIVSPV